MKGRVFFIAAVASALVITNARATAPQDQYALYNRDDILIHDNYTHLDWERAPTSGTLSQSNAALYCAALAIDANGPWRLPSYKELLTLVDERIEVFSSGVPKAIDLNAFPDTDVAAACYWSSSIAPAGGPAGGYCVRFDDGSTATQALAQPLYVRCVRSTP